MQEQSWDLEKLFKTQISGFILGDLAEMMKLKPNVQGFGECNVPAARMIMFTMELLGACLSENLQGLSREDHLRNFIALYIPEITQDDREDLVINFRSRLRKAYNPLTGLDCYYVVRKLPHETKLIDREKEIDLTLNLSKLYEYFLEAINRLEQDICVTRDNKIINNFYANLPILNNKNKNQVKNKNYNEHSFDFGENNFPYTGA